MTNTRHPGGTDPRDVRGPGGTRPIPATEAETKARLDGVDSNRRFPSIPGVVLTGELGRGGMGVVYCGKQEKLGRIVAVKTLGTDYRGGAIERRFLNEGKNQARLDHPNVVVCHDSGTTREGEPYLVLEYVGGPNLLEWVREHGPLPAVEALHIALALTRALEHGLEKNLVHRDVKPENVLLKPDSHARSKSFPFVPKLADFGLARTDEGPGVARLTQQGEAWGSPQTMAPEQFDGFADVDHRADIYALGCVLHYVLTGKQAFRDTTVAELRRHKRDGPVPDPRGLVADLHAPTADLVVAMLAIQPDARPLDYAALEARLQVLLDELQPAALREDARRRRIVLLVVLPLVVATIAAVAWIIVRDRRGSTNAAPQLTVLRGPARVDAGTRNDVTVEATDPEGGPVAYEWEFEGPAWWKAPAAIDSPTVVGVNCPEPPEPGDYEIVTRVRAVDDTGARSTPRELRLLVLAGAAGRPLTEPVVLSPEDDAALARAWTVDPAAFEMEDVDRIFARSINVDREMSRVLPRGPFVLTGTITVARGDARMQALLSLDFERGGASTRSIRLVPAEGSPLMQVESIGFEAEKRGYLNSNQALDLTVTWDGSRLAVRARARESDREAPLLDVVASGGQRPETLRVKVFGGDFVLENLRLEPLPPK